MTDPLDPHNLLTSGVDLATLPELAELLGVSHKALRALFQTPDGPLYDRVPLVRSPKGGGPWRYSVADARAAIAPFLPEIEARRQRAAEREARERAAKAARMASANAAGQKGERIPASSKMLRSRARSQTGPRSGPAEDARRSPASHESRGVQVARRRP